jgi:hypothetical protein
MSDMYSRHNVASERPGLWVSGDGEYDFERSGRRWTAFHRAHWTGGTFATGGRFVRMPIGNGPTLDSVFAIAARHYVTPAGDFRYEVIG